MQFKTFESQWESDSDEEDFVDNLAQKMLVDQAEGAPVDVDDDPDMDDWGSLSGDGDDASDGGGDSSQDEAAGSDGEADDDAFMDDASSDDSGAGSDDGSPGENFDDSSPGTKRKSAGGGLLAGKKSKVGRRRGG